MLPTAPSPEFDLLRLAARGELDPARARALTAAAAGALEWADVLQRGSHHKLLPLLHAHLRTHAGVPETVRALLLARARATSQQALFLLAEMARIGDRLRSEGLPFVILKGPSLADAYGGLAKRPFLDNDILVDPESFPRVERALLDLGFQERKRSALQQRGYLYVHGEYTFGRRVGPMGSTVDVHTRLVPFGYRYAPRVRDLLDRARDVPVAGSSVPAPSWEDTFVALCVNALKDQWNRLRLASDLAEVGTFVDWGVVRERAARGRCLRAVRLAALVATDELDAEFPEAVVADARRDARAVDLSEHIRLHFQTFHLEHVLEGKDRARLNLLAQDGVRGQVRYSSYVALRRMTEWFVDPAEPGA